jgi:tetraprenyl-beta-curcumene synthase
VPAPAREDLMALALANARFWPSVFGRVRGELARWRGPASQIPDPALRTLALAKLEHEAFNAEVAATLATLAPRRQRAEAVRAIVALEVLFDYLDGRTERIEAEPIARATALYAPFRAVVDGYADGDGALDAADGEYLRALSRIAHAAFGALPSAGAVAAPARRAAERCAQAQTRIHAAATLGAGQLEQWAREHGRGSELGWREYAAGGASSVLSMHALIAAAADPRTSAADGELIDDCYLAICALITILDSLVDRVEDAASGQAGFESLYQDEELERMLPELIAAALVRCRHAPHGAHHAMTLAGVAAYYTTHPGARDARARAASRLVRSELSPTIWPALAVMRSWRAAKRARMALPRGGINPVRQASDTRGAQRA